MLVNFNIDRSTITKLDQLCRFVGRSRTSVIVDMIEKFIIEDGGELALNRRKLNALGNAAVESAELKWKLNEADDKFLEWINALSDQDDEEIAGWYSEFDT